MARKQDDADTACLYPLAGVPIFAPFYFLMLYQLTQAFVRAKFILVF